MNTSPFMDPGHSGPGRRGRGSATRRHRRRHRRLVAAALMLGVLALAILLDLILFSPATERAHGSPHAANDARATAVASSPHTAGATASAHAGVAPAGAGAPALSPAGFPLGKPALALTGLENPGQDPVQLAFRHPPRAGILVNLSSGQVLWQLHPLERLHIASLTKMMTALLAVTSSPPEAPVLITRRAVDMAGSKIGVLPLGRHVPLESLLYGLLLPSGNDAAVALAEHVSGNVNAFVKRMNAEAAALGLACTRYSSPSGYYNLGDYSCPADLAVLAGVDERQPRIAAVTRTLSAALPFPIKGGKLFLYNNNPLLIYHYPGTTGLKTGYTEAAGRCLVATAERDGLRLAAIILNSTEPGTQARRLLDRGFDDVYHLPRVPEQSMPPGA